MSQMSVQEKVADLERRIDLLETAQRRAARTTTTTTITSGSVDLEPEWSGLWKQFDALIKKAFK